MYFISDIIMGRKCCVTNRNGNYDSQAKEKTFRLPRDMDEREQWLKIIPRHNTPDTKNTVVCERHWPQGYETVKRFGKERPRYPPSVFACVKPSLQRTPAPATRATKKTYSEVRNQRPDELNSFNEADRILNHETFKSEDIKHNFGCPVTVSTTKNEIYLQSEELLESTGIFELMLKIKEDF